MEEKRHSSVVDYLRKCGYLTEGFVGDGPVRLSFVKNKDDKQDIVIGLRVARSDPSLEFDIAVVKIHNKNSDVQTCADNLLSATHFATGINANKCFLASYSAYDADDREIAEQMGVGLLEIEGKTVKEVVPAKHMKSAFIEFPKHKFDGLKLVQDVLEISDNDWGRLARVFCRADDAWCGFNVGDVFVELEKMEVVLDISISVKAGPVMKEGSYMFKFGELAGFLVNGNDDRYTFVEKLGKMFVFTQSEWNFMLRLLSKVDMCHLVFHIGSARIIFAKHPG
jgi:hypothetical protein